MSTSRSRRRRRGNGPMVVLIVAAVIPALMLLLVASWAGGRADASDDAVPAVDPATPTTLAPAPAPAK